MCGISGIVSTVPLTQGQRNTARSMNQCLDHRGPDGDGWYQSEHTQMGMRRLSIIDLAGANQPLYNEDKTIIVLFNGEIYNYVELRASLINKGHTFTTDGDGETINHLYEDEGIDGLLQLRGMYAISLFDTTKNIVYLIRDRMSEKPIYYMQKDDVVFYASEFKAIRKAVDESDLTLNPEAIDTFLHYQFVPEPMTMVKEIKKVPAAHYAKINLNTLNLEIVKYWDMLDSPAITTDHPAQLVCDEMVYISDIIGRSDVPVGIALSGGLDSSAVAALVKHHNSNKDITNAFTIGYEGQPIYDERKKAQLLADELGITLHQIELSAAEYVRDFKELVYAMDDPIADPAAYSISRVMKAASEKGIKVMLNGIGADEIFWGYQWISDAVTETKRRIASGDAEHIAFYDLNADYVFFDTVSSKLYTKAFVAQLPDDTNTRYAAIQTSNEPHIAMIERLCSTWLFSNAVALSDRLSMQHSIELRSPFLDYKLVELAVGLNKANPDIYTQPTKQILKDAVSKFLPKEVLQRNKQGFRPPMESWFTQVFEKYGGLLKNGYLMQHNVLNSRALWKLKWMRGQPALILRYKLLLLEIWCRTHLSVEKIDDL